jgi:hypothetical protein
MRSSICILLVLAGCSSGDGGVIGNGVATRLVLVSGDSQTATAGQDLPAPLVVEAQDNSGDAVIGTTVTWAVVSGGGVVAQTTSLAGADGHASMTVTLGGAVGANVFTAAAPGLQGSPVTFTETGAAPGPAATALSLSSLPNPSVFGQSVSFTAAINANSAAAPTGTLTFFDGIAQIGVISVDGGARTLDAAGLAAGAHSIKVVYSGDSRFIGSTSPVLAQTVDKATPGLSLSVTQATAGAAVEFQVSANGNASAAPAGTVTISKQGSPAVIASCTLAQASASTGSCSTSGSVSPGSVTFVIDYAGDANYAESSVAAPPVTIQ